MERYLQPKEISCRVQQVRENGLTLLLYITSRAAQTLLDEIYGPLNWQREHELIDGQLFCTISVWDEEKEQWISRQDVGKESYTEKEKGRASDSFKRAAVNFGLGRELYTAPYIWVDAKSANIKPKKDGKTFTTYDKFFVKSVTYTPKGDIDSLEIINQDLNTVFKKWPSKTIGLDKINVLNKAIEESGIDISKIYEMCSIKDLKEMREEEFQPVYNKLLAQIKKNKGE